MTSPTVGILVSAYFAEQFMASKMLNLAMISTPCTPIIICQQFSKEHRIAEGALKKYAWKIKPRLVLTKDIPKLYKAWNLGIQSFRADYYTTSNTDDTHSPDGISILLKRIEQTGTDICYGSYIIQCSDTGNKIAIKSKKTSLKALARGYYLGPFPLWRADLHLKYGLFDETYFSAGDYEFFQRVMMGGATVSCVPTIIGNFLWHKKNIEAKYRKEALKEVRHIHEIYKNYQQSITKTSANQSESA